MSKRNKWIFSQKENNLANQRLILFNHAAGTVMLYKELLPAIPETYDICPVQYPMRANRMNEKMPDSIEKLAADFITENLDLFEIPFILFGHSMGAQVAYETARQLKERGIVPKHLILSACEAPDNNKDNIVAPSPDSTTAEDIYDEKHLIEILKSYDHMVTPEILQDREFLDYYLPIVRADFSISDNYCRAPDILLDCKISVLLADSDMHVDSAKCLSWAAYTKGETDFYEFSGDHFYLEDSENINKIIKNILGGDSN